MTPVKVAGIRLTIHSWRNIAITLIDRRSGIVVGVIACLRQRSRLLDRVSTILPDESRGRSERCDSLDYCVC